MRVYTEDFFLRALASLLRLTHRADSSSPFQPSAHTSEKSQELKAQVFELEELKSENQSLKKILALSEEKKFSVRGAHVLHHGTFLGREFLIIDQGHAEGLTENLPVIDENGFFVGVIKEVTNRFAKVEIASNPGGVFEGEVLPVSVTALAKGVGGRTFELELIPTDVPIRRGDLVRFFGIPEKNKISFSAGEIVSVESSTNRTFKKAKAFLVARPEVLRIVFVVKGAP